MELNGNLKRITVEQREAMLEFMEANPDVARNQISGPNSSSIKAAKWRELSELLNSSATGVSKTPEKWMKSWQDWRSDVKQKASKLRRHAASTGGGPSKGTPLTPLEERLLTFIGGPAVGVVDPLEIVTVCSDGTIEFPITVEKSSFETSPSSLSLAASPTPPPAKKFCAASHDLEERAVASNERTSIALEKIAATSERAVIAQERMADAIGQIASAMLKMTETMGEMKAISSSNS